MDAFILSRMQFAANISFHILFPMITIALSWVLLFFKVRHNMTGREHWRAGYMFWVKVFALSFGLGVVTGVTMSFQFGTNWPGFMETVGNIAGPLLAYEVLTAFFLEAAFLGIMLFGWSRVPNWLHTTATFLVAFGTLMSAFWILTLNSWMHTPAGFEMRNGIAHAASWIEIILNPSMPYRLTHTLLASGLTVAFLILGFSAYRWLIGDRGGEVKATLKFSIFLAAALIPVQIFIGDKHGLNTLEYQPQKVAAMEGNWETQGGVPLLLFAIPDEDARENHFEIRIPRLASLILTHELDGEVPGLNDFVTEEGEVRHPPVGPVFFAFRIMVGTGMAMLLLSWIGVACLGLRRKARRWSVDNLPKPFFVVAVAMAFSGWVATISGWYTTEIGRQPWLVDGVLLTETAVADVPPPVVASSLIIYIAVYGILLFAYIAVLTFMARKAAKTEPVAGFPKPLAVSAELRT